MIDKAQVAEIIKTLREIVQENELDVDNETLLTEAMDFYIHTRIQSGGFRSTSSPPQPSQSPNPSGFEPATHKQLAVLKRRNMDKEMDLAKLSKKEASAIIGRL